MRQEVVAPPPTARPPQAKPATGPRKPSRDPFEFRALVRTQICEGGGLMGCLNPFPESVFAQSGIQPKALM